MAWGYGTTKADAKAYEAAVETDVAEADVDSTSFYLDDAVGPTMEFGAPAWYGEDETYGTQGAWLAGEGLSEAWGYDPKDRISPTYDNTVMEYMGEHPLLPLVGLDARGMLRRGGSLGPWDYAALGLSMIPVAGPAALKMASPYIKNTVSPWLKNAFRSKYKSVTDTTLSGDELAYDHYARTVRGRGEIPLSRSTWDKRPGPQTREQMQVKLDQQRALAMDVRKMSPLEFNAMDTKIQDRLLQNANLSRRDIEIIHWEKTEKLFGEVMASHADEIGNTKLAASIRAKIKATDDFIKNLSVEEQKRLGIYDWFGRNQMAIWRENQTKVALKPGHIGMSDMEWATLVKGKTLSEVKDIARKLTLRIVD